MRSKSKPRRNMAESYKNCKQSWLPPMNCGKNWNEKTFTKIGELRSHMYTVKPTFMLVCLTLICGDLLEAKQAYFEHSNFMHIITLS
nr:hypothetical protein CFP56_57459 [Quercus suber]